MLKLFCMSSAAVLFLVAGTQYLLFLNHPGVAELPSGLLLHAIVILMPALAVIGLPLGGLLLGAEPGMGFRTWLSGYRAVRPISSCVMAAQSLWAALGMWLVVWGCWILLIALHLRLHPVFAEMDVAGLQSSATRLMAVTAHALVGALPVVMWGRLDGFPNVLVTSMVAWAGTWWLSGLIGPETGSEVGTWTFGQLLLGIKWVVGVSALGIGWRRGHVTGNFAIGLVGGWLVVVGLLGVLESESQRSMERLIMLAVFVPFARPALCPLAVAANRHR